MVLAPPPSARRGSRAASVGQRVEGAGGPPRGVEGVQGAEGRGAGRLPPRRLSGAGGSPEDAAQHILHMSSEEEEV